MLAFWIQHDEISPSNAYCSSTAVLKYLTYCCPVHYDKVNAFRIILIIEKKNQGKNELVK